MLDVYLKVFNGVKSGDLKKAWQAQVQLERCCRIFKYGGMAALFKEGMRLRGFDAGFVRPPQRELTKDEKKQLAQELAAEGLIK